MPVYGLHNMGLGEYVKDERAEDEDMEMMDVDDMVQRVEGLGV